MFFSMKSNIIIVEVFLVVLYWLMFWNVIGAIVVADDDDDADDVLKPILILPEVLSQSPADGLQMYRSVWLILWMWFLIFN